MIRVNTCIGFVRLSFGSYLFLYWGSCSLFPWQRKIGLPSFLHNQFVAPLTLRILTLAYEALLVFFNLTVLALTQAKSIRCPALVDPNTRNSDLIVDAARGKQTWLTHFRCQMRQTSSLVAGWLAVAGWWEHFKIIWPSWAYWWEYQASLLAG